MSQIPPYQPPQYSGYRRPQNYGRPASVRLDSISEAWQLFTQDWATWSGATLIVLLISTALMVVPVVVFIVPIAMSANARTGRLSDTSMLAILPMYAVLYLGSFFMYYMGHALLANVVLRKLRGESVSIGDMFSFDGMFWQHVIAGVITAIGTIVGLILCYLPGLLFMGLTMFVPFLITDKRMSATQAIQTSYETLKAEMWMSLAFALVIGIVVSVGMMVCCFGYCASYPLHPLSVGILYRDYFMAPDGMMAGPTQVPTDFSRPPGG